MFGLLVCSICNLVLTYTPVSDSYKNGTVFDGETYIENATFYF